MPKYFVYILKCSDLTYYTGVTSNLQQRLLEHKEGKHPKSYTYGRRPVSLVYCAEFSDVRYAISKEKQIKKWSKAKKKALINGDFDLLVALSKKKG